MSVYGLSDVDVESVYPMPLSIQILGAIRAKEAIDLLIDCIDYMPKPIDSPIFEGDINIWALAKIGKPAADKCIEEIARGNKKTDLLMRVIEEVYGEKLACVVMRMVAGEKNDIEKNRLFAALKTYEEKKAKDRSTPSETRSTDPDKNEKRAGERTGENRCRIRAIHRQGLGRDSIGA